MNDNADLTPTFSSRMSKAFSNLVRAFLILIIVAGIAAAVYFGTPFLYQKFILPVETNTARLKDVEDKQIDEVQKINQQISDLKARMGVLENSQTSNSTSIAEMKGQMDALEIIVDRQSATIKQLDDLQSRLENLQKSNDIQENIIEELDRQVTITRSVELLSRAYIYLVQNNYGLARDDLRAAYSLLSNLEVENTQALQSVLKRLEMAISNLPDYPIVAVDDVEAAWQILIGGFSPITPTTSTLSIPTFQATKLPSIPSDVDQKVTPENDSNAISTPTP